MLCLMYSQSFNANNIYVKFSPFFCQKNGTEIIHIIFPPNEKKLKHFGL